MSAEQTKEANDDDNFPDSLYDQFDEYKARDAGTIRVARILRIETVSRRGTNRKMEKRKCMWLEYGWGTKNSIILDRAWCNTMLPQVGDYFIVFPPDKDGDRLAAPMNPKTFELIFGRVPKKEQEEKEEN